MRTIYEEKKINWEIQQGSIINNCISEDYPDYEVYGIIITPRCDIGNKKVSTIHYLPVIKFDDWLKKDFIKLFEKQYKQNQKTALISKFKENNISPTILENNISKADIIKIINQKVTRKQLDQTLLFLNNYFNIEESDKISDIIKSNFKIRDIILKDIKDGKDRNYHLIEDWNEKGKYVVVLLRDVRRITSSLADKLSKSVFEGEVLEHEWGKNDLKMKNDSENILCIEAQLKSPFIEHLIQLFFYNFGRIGVDDMHKETIDELNLVTNKIFDL